MMNYFQDMRFGFGQYSGLQVSALPVVLLIIVWTLFWKGLALWHAAKRNEKGWFVAMLILNTLGLVEIVYLVAVVKIKFSSLKK